MQELTLPLRHEDIIRQQARDKDLDPALDRRGHLRGVALPRRQTSHAGAQGLMQITPATAQLHRAASRAAPSSSSGDLATPQVNISYGACYLRYLLDRYGGNETLALAAYNGGEGNVDRWIAEARGASATCGIGDIPFPETREYVRARARRARRVPPHATRPSSGI